MNSYESIIQHTNTVGSFKFRPGPTEHLASSQKDAAVLTDDGVCGVEVDHVESICFKVTAKALI